MERFVEALNVYESDDYLKFVFDNKENRIIRKDAEYRRLYNDIKDKGQLHPIFVQNYNEKYLIVDGQHRYTILKDLNLPIKFFNNNSIDMAKEIGARIVTIKYRTVDFIIIGANKEIPIFMLIYRLLNSNENKLQISSLIEITFTYIINHGDKIFRNTKFNKDCFKNYKEALNRYNKTISDDVFKQIYELISLIDEMAKVLEIETKTVKVNLVREALLYHLDYKRYGVSLKSIISFLKTEKPSKYSYSMIIKNTYKDKHFREIFREISSKLSKAKNDKKAI